MKLMIQSPYILIYSKITIAVAWITCTFAFNSIHHLYFVYFMDAFVIYNSLKLASNTFWPSFDLKNSQIMSYNAFLSFTRLAFLPILQDKDIWNDTPTFPFPFNQDRWPLLNNTTGSHECIKRNASHLKFPQHSITAKILQWICAMSLTSPKRDIYTLERMMKLRHI